MGRTFLVLKHVERQFHFLLEVKDVVPLSKQHPPPTGNHRSKGVGQMYMGGGGGWM